jgi:hypothetical protein
MAAAMLNGGARAIFAAIEHPDGTGYFWNGIGSKVWNGITWRGSGALGSVTPIKQSSEIAIQELSFQLNGIDAETAARLSGDVRNRKGTVWLACLDDTGQVVQAPYLIADTLLDHQAIEYADDGSAVITITAYSGFFTLDRGVDEAWTPESQRLRFPTDVGLDMIPGLQKQDLQWTPT